MLFSCTQPISVDLISFFELAIGAVIYLDGFISIVCMFILSIEVYNDAIFIKLVASIALQSWFNISVSFIGKNFYQKSFNKV